MDNQIYTNIIVYGLTAIEIILKSLTSFIVSKIGYRTISKEARELISVTFYTQWLNVLVLYLLSRVDFEYMPVLNNLFSGETKGKSLNKFADLTTPWYIFSSKLLIDSLIFNMFFP